MIRAANKNKSVVYSDLLSDHISYIDSINEVFRGNNKNKSVIPIDTRKIYYKKIKNIKKIIVNEPATVIVDLNGSKTVVKYYEEFGVLSCDRVEYSKTLGFEMCLIKFLIDNGRIYSDVVKHIFQNSKEALTAIEKAEAILISFLGERDFKSLYEWFLEKTN